MKQQNNIYVTKHLKELWNNKHLTNSGKFQHELEKRSAELHGVEYISLFLNGTLALIVNLQALRIIGEVITTPYSLVTTTHSLHWNNIKPAFCDIREQDGNLDPDKIEAQITPQNYGNLCDNGTVQKVADTYGLKILYDETHSFGIEKDRETILNWGDFSSLASGVMMGGLVLINIQPENIL